MTAKPIIPREAARRDVDDILDFYLDTAGDGVALGFVAALEQTYRTIAERPAIGSPRYAHELDLPGMRSRKLARFPHLVFYFERDDHIDVWRILHAKRNIPAWLDGDDS